MMSSNVKCSTSLAIGAIDGVLENIFTFIHLEYPTIILKKNPIIFKKYTQVPIVLIFYSNLYIHFESVILSKELCGFVSKTAASIGHLEGLKWACSKNCTWNAETCKAAAAGGHLEVLQWARANGCQW
jgi:hypothetical protein